MLVNTFSANEKYFLLNRDNLKQPIHMQLFAEAKTFFLSFFFVFEVYIKFRTASKKDGPHS